MDDEPIIFERKTQPARMGRCNVIRGYKYSCARRRHGMMIAAETKFETNSTIYIVAPPQQCVIATLRRIVNAKLRMGQRPDHIFYVYCRPEDRWTDDKLEDEKRGQRMLFFPDVKHIEITQAPKYPWEKAHLQARLSETLLNAWEEGSEVRATDLIIFDGTLGGSPPTLPGFNKVHDSIYVTHDKECPIDPGTIGCGKLPLLVLFPQASIPSAWQMRFEFKSILLSMGSLAKDVEKGKEDEMCVVSDLVASDVFRDPQPIYEASWPPTVCYSTAQRSPYICHMTSALLLRETLAVSQVRGWLWQETTEEQGEPPLVGLVLSIAELHSDLLHRREESVRPQWKVSLDLSEFVLDPFVDCCRFYDRAPEQ